ncbi:hypothetical protein HN014_22350 (plasmid) [Aquimarina sp. TRL1]|uniref:hypothetical protein n=1 Tax=Aquimarina sp. (strain TRL1) TaxID=2736252 RepID=UPI00158BFC97|nr:hypothetical protein [Aquimarina sp. TRL1]QKX07744.1 hypothetical protein HN014_22350 [Aquimarina sp. TRL1]
MNDIYINKKDDKVFIDFLNKEKKFKKDRIFFEGVSCINDAINWGKNNLENFHMDMINHV